MSIPEQEQPESKQPIAHTFNTLRELIDHVSGKALADIQQGDSGHAEVLPFPFLAIVGQREMKLALMLGLVNPNIGGILLIGPRGTAKTTAVRSLLALLPQVERSTCHYGCLPEDVESGGLDAICPDCARKYAEGKSLTAPDRARLIELPLNARLEDVIGGIDERAAIHERMRIRRGILSQADRNLLYIDEVNLLTDDIVDAILDAAAQGFYVVRRGPVTATYRSRFVLIGSMNPEEGKLRPQIMDRFGLRVMVRGLEDDSDRLEAYRRVQTYLANPRTMISLYADEIAAAGQEIQVARERLKQVEIPDKVARPAIKLVQDMNIDSLRAEITWFESARAFTSADGRTQVTTQDLKEVAPMCLRLRRSPFMTEYINNQKGEEEELRERLEELGKSPKTSRARKSAKK
jgi:magnesium chelatase subunit I